MSFMYIMNNKGPKMDPWGTPVVIEVMFDLVPS